MLNSSFRAKPLPRPCPGDMALSSLWLLGLALNLGTYEQRISISPLSLSMWKRKTKKGTVSSCSQFSGKDRHLTGSQRAHGNGAGRDGPALCVPREPHSTAA